MAQGKATIAFSYKPLARDLGISFKILKADLERIKAAGFIEISVPSEFPLGSRGGSLTSKRWTLTIKDNSETNIVAKFPDRFPLGSQQVPEQKKTTKKKEPPAGSKVWDAYELAYENRYHAKPVRNAMANALCAQLVKRLGEEAHSVAQFYVGHNSEFYVRNLHPLKFLVSDAEKLRTEWSLGAQMTTGMARKVDKNATIDAAFDEFERRRREKNGSGTAEKP